MKEFKERKKPSQPQGTFFKPKVQKKLAIGKPGDKYEAEADATADKVTSRSGAPDVQQSAQPEIQQQPLAESVSPVQMKEMGEEDPIQKQPEQDENAVQKKETDDKDPIQKQSEEEAPVQQKAEEDQVVQQKEDNQDPIQRKENNASPTTESKLSASKGQGTPVSGKVKQEMESGFGADFSRVRIHTDTPAEQMSQEMNAQAFTHGNDIYFNKGKYNPVSKEGKHLLAHELTHTIQQKGMVQQKVQRHMQDKYPWDGYVSAPISAALRKNPAKSHWIADIPKGTRLTVIGNSGNWIQVRVMVDGIQKTGYMSQELVSLSKTDGVANEMESMVGDKAAWQGSGPSRLTGRSNTFVTWAEAKSEGVAPPVTSVTVINCWEMILLAAYRSGAITWDFIHKLYLNTKGNWGDELPRRLTSGSRSTYDIIKKTPKPKRGELVFFNDASHVALATGSGDEILTFWPPPNTKFTGDKTIDAVKKSTIGALYTYMKKNYPSLGTPKVTIGTPIW